MACGSEAEANVISGCLIERNLAACVNVTTIRSIFQWQGKTESHNEWLLIIKTLRSLFPAVEQAVKANHSYECPEVIALDMCLVSKQYENWVVDSCKKAKKTEN